MAKQDPFEAIFSAIREDPQNSDYTARGIDPLYFAGTEATILIIGQAPGQKAQDTRMYWNDISGDRLRDWLGVTREEFYDSGKISIIPMDFYYPGHGKSGDLPPRKGFAEKWHPKLLALMPDIQLTVLIGNYACKRYLHMKSKDKLTDIVKDYQSYLPTYFPLVHPSPRNQLWMSRNPWFAGDVLPVLKEKVREAMK